MFKTKTSYLVSSVLVLLCFSGPALAQSEKKVLYGVLIDNSGSLRSQFDRVVQLGTGVVRQVHPNGPMTIFNFKGVGDPKNSPPLMVAGTVWSEDRNLLDNYINNLFVQPGQTTLFDAVHSIVERINAKATSEPDAYSRKVIILITDGEDRKSKVKVKDLIVELKQNNIQLYAIGLVHELEKEGGMYKASARDQAIKSLTTLTKETGGRAIFPKSNGEDVSELVQKLLEGHQ